MVRRRRRQSQWRAERSAARAHRGRGARGHVSQVERAPRRAALQGCEGAPDRQRAQDRRHAPRRKEGAGGAPLVSRHTRQRLGFASRCANSHFHSASSAYAGSHAPWPMSGYSVYFTSVPASRIAFTSFCDCTVGTTSSFAPWKIQIGIPFVCAATYAYGSSPFTLTNRLSMSADGVSPPDAATAAAKTPG